MVQVELCIHFFMLAGRGCDIPKPSPLQPPCNISPHVPTKTNALPEIRIGRIISFVTTRSPIFSSTTIPQFQSTTSRHIYLRRTMRELQLSLNQTQQVRLEKALHQIQSLSSKTNSSGSASVTVADTIPVNQDDGVLKGHGTTDLDGEIVATLCGVVERVNKLVYVRTLKAKYKPEIGDIVVGRVIEVAPKRWRIEMNFSQDAMLMLSSMNMPDGVQRRRTAVDELNMRDIFVENDVICAEVRGLQHDGSVQLQARSQKYGKLEKGQLLTVSPYLIKRRKHHFHHLEQYGIDLILGCNGFIWVGEHVQVRDAMVIDDPVKKTPSLEEQEKPPYTPFEKRQVICRISNAIRVLSSLGFTLTLEVIMETVELSMSENVDIHDMLGAEFYVQIAEREVQRRNSLGKRKV